MSELAASTQVAPLTGFVEVAAADDVPPGWVLKVRIGSREIALANCEGTLHAVDNACTHAAGPLGDSRLKQSCLLECAWHNSLFDARTGDVVRGPARKPLRSYEVLVQGGSVFVATD